MNGQGIFSALWPAGGMKYSRPSGLMCPNTWETIVTHTVAVTVLLRVARRHVTLERQNLYPWNCVD